MSDCRAGRLNENDPPTQGNKCSGLGQKDENPFDVRPLASAAKL